jgi:hypothetical protein
MDLNKTECERKYGQSNEPSVSSTDRLAASQTLCFMTQLPQFVADVRLANSEQLKQKATYKGGGGLAFPRTPL